MLRLEGEMDVEVAPLVKGHLQEQFRSTAMNALQLLSTVAPFYFHQISSISSPHLTGTILLALPPFALLFNTTGSSLNILPGPKSGLPPRLPKISPI